MRAAIRGALGGVLKKFDTLSELNEIGQDLSVGRGHLM